MDLVATVMAQATQVDLMSQVVKVDDKNRHHHPRVTTYSETFLKFAKFIFACDWVLNVCYIIWRTDKKHKMCTFTISANSIAYN